MPSSRPLARSPAVTMPAFLGARGLDEHRATNAIESRHAATLMPPTTRHEYY